MTGVWNFRPLTLDRAIYNGVVHQNEYRLPEAFSPDDIVIDVGCHIGSFAYAAASRACQQVYAVEPDLENLKLAAEHLRPYIDQGFVTLVHGAVWRSDPNDDELRFDGYHPFPKSFPGMHGTLNTGNGSVIWGEGEIVPKIAFDEIVDSLTDCGQKRIRFLKLDCEGSEWPILLTSSRLHLIDEIGGEFHEIGGEYLEITEDRTLTEPIFRHDSSMKYTVDVLERFFNAAGFSFTSRRHLRPTTGAVEGLGLFFATRHAPTG
jgi:FkbM family methyltransferase